MRALLFRLLIPARKLNARPSEKPESACSVGAAAGFFAEFADRSAAYLDEVVSVHVIPNLLSTYEGGFRTRLRGGPVVWIPTGGGAPELFVDYGGSVGFENGTRGRDHREAPSAIN